MISPTLNTELYVDINHNMESHVKTQHGFPCTRFSIMFQTEDKIEE